jgi:hypothetical protein
MAVWAEAREVLEPMFDRVFAGDPVSIEDFSLGLDRQGHIEEAHFEFAYTPARGETARPRDCSVLVQRPLRGSWLYAARHRTRSDSGDYSSVRRVLLPF